VRRWAGRSLHSRGTRQFLPAVGIQPFADERLRTLRTAGRIDSSGERPQPSCDPTTLANCVPFSDMDAITRMAAPCTTASPPTCANASTRTTSSSPPIPGPMPSTIRPTYSPRWHRRTVSFPPWSAPTLPSINATGSCSAACIKPASCRAAVLAGASSATGTFAPIIEIASGRPFLIITAKRRTSSSRRARPSEPGHERNA